MDGGLVLEGYQFLKERVKEIKVFIFEEYVQSRKVGELLFVINFKGYFIKI